MEAYRTERVLICMYNLRGALARENISVILFPPYCNKLQLPTLRATIGLTEIICPNIWRVLELRKF